MSAVTDLDLRFGSDSADPTGVRDCQTCGGFAVVAGAVCPDCFARQQLRNAWWHSSSGPEMLRRVIEKMKD